MLYFIMLFAKKQEKIIVFTEFTIAWWARRQSKAHLPTCGP
jgi:hypothetical protein